MRILPTNKTSFPIQPGVYRMLDKDDNIIYIGKAKNLKNRLSSYFDNSAKSARIKLMIAEIVSIEVTIAPTENDALILEQKLISKIKPRYNIIFRDDKSYPFIALSKHNYSKIYITREKTTKINKENLFGPYPQSSDAYKNVEYIQKIFQLRTCNDSEFGNRSRPCMLHSIGKCLAPCTNKNKEGFKEMYEENVAQAKKLLKGQVTNTVNSLQEKMVLHSENFEYEKAAKIRDTINAIKDLSHQQTIYSVKEDDVIVFNYIQGKKTYLGYSKILAGTPQEVFHIEVKGDMKDFDITELMTRYIENYIVNNTEGETKVKIISNIKLPELFYNYQHNHLSKQYKDWLEFVENNLNVVMTEDLRKDEHQSTIISELEKIFIPKIRSLECIDISHFNGEATYGGKIRWAIDPIERTGQLDKEYYRLSRFPGNVIDDVAHINKTVDRIYHSDNDIPTILIIDGDVPQMEAAYKALKEKDLNKDFILLSSAKGSTRKKGVEIIHIHQSCVQLIHPKYVKENVLNLVKDNPVRHLVQHLQDTAHDFSNNARKQKMSKDRFSKDKKAAT